MAIGNPITLTNNVASKSISATATADQTLFTVTGGYRINQLTVFRNGVRLVGGSDFTANDGSSVTLLTAANLNDTIEFQVFDDFSVADAINSSGAQTLDGTLNVTGGFNIGIQSGGTDVTTGVITAINFIGTGNTAVYDSASKTVDISIAGNAGAAGTWTNYDTNTGVSTTKKVKIENNLEVTGITTSTGGFVGNVTGNASGLTGTPNITVGNISASGGDLTIRNITGVAATFSGVLTYEDVTNVDSVGVVTARSGIEFGASGVGGTITATGQAEFAGVCTASSFVGDGTGLTGVASTDNIITSTASTFANINSTGIISATSFEGNFILDSYLFN